MKGIAICAAFLTMAAAAGCLSCRSAGETTGYEIEAGGRTVRVTPLTDDIIRVTADPASARIAYVPTQAIALEEGPVEVTVAKNDSLFTLQTRTTRVTVDRRSGRVVFSDSLGRELLAEADGIDNGSSVKRVSLKGKPGAWHGAGERGHKLDMRGDTLAMWNRQNYAYTGDDPRISQMGITVPWIVNEDGTGVFFDDYHKGNLIVGDTLAYVSESEKPLGYYFVNGHGTLAGATERYAQLTGHQPLPPVWALGYITSKYGYRDQREALGAVDSLTAAGYPVDAIVLDLYWYGVETDMGRLEWDTVKWPTHKEMLARLRDRGINTVLITQPYVNKNGAIDNYNFLSGKGMLVRDSAGGTHDVTTWVGDAGMIDVSNPATREWLWNRLKGLTAEGVAGWWGDLGEPEVHPESVVHANGESGPDYHNVYGNDWSRLLFEGLRRDFPGMRPMLMMRGGTAGLQRYGVMPWTTDVARSWGGFEPQVVLMLNSGLSGLGYMSSDLGGFAVDSVKPRDGELYVRWIQAGAFTPVMRTHAQYQPEPYHYPEYGKILKEYVGMRYRWMPYTYTLAWENAEKGWPLVRPLDFHGNSGVEGVSAIRDEYLWGDEVLVAPVMTEGARSRKVVFPKGEWIDWHHPERRWSGPCEAVVDAPLDELPLFVRSGSFIPQYCGPEGNISEMDPALLTVEYYPSDKETAYTLFDDDRRNPRSLEEGLFQLTRFTGKSTDGKTEIAIESNGGSYEGMPASRTVTLEVVGTGKPREVFLSDGTAMRETKSAQPEAGCWSYFPSSRRLMISFDWNYKPLEIRIE